MSQSHGFCKDFPVKMQNMLDRFIRNGVCKGACIAVGRFGNLAVRCQSGWANAEQKDPICGSTLFQMYSLTKPVTAVAVMQLWEKGCFQLSDPVSKYLPAYGDVQVCHVQQDGTEVLLNAKRQITVHDLLTMTSGIPYGGTGLIGESLERLSEGMIQSRANGCPWDTLEYVNQLSKVPLLFEPGTRYQYGLGFDVLGALVQIWSGKPLDQYCQDHIFSPLGIETATFLITQAQKRKLAASYTKNDAGNLVPQHRVATPSINAYTLDNTSYFSGGSGLICTLDNYFKFAKMLANRGRTDTGDVLIKESTLKMISEPRLTCEQLQSFPQHGDTCLHAAGYSYGYGVHVMKDPQNHLPAGEWGWAGTMGTWLSIDPQNEVFWVYAHQVTPSDYGSYIPELSKLIYSSLR